MTLMYRHRLAKLAQHVAGAADDATTAVLPSPIKPGSLKYEKLEKNMSGDGALAAQGFGHVSQVQPPKFTPDQHEEICAFFRAEGYAVIVGAMDQGEVDHLNNFFSSTQADPKWMRAWGLGDVREGYHNNQGLIYSQPLLDHPELDKYTQHPGNYRVVCDLLGGDDKPRHAEFNFREAPEGAGKRAMNVHHDAAQDSRINRDPYGAPDWMCAIHYLTDVNENTPAFAVVPHSHLQLTLKDAYENIPDYSEQPLFGPAGTCVLYDTALYHTRLDGKDDSGKIRRTVHQYYARGSWDEDGRGPTPPLTNWNVFPKRLAASEDPDKRRFFSHWNTAMCEWAASDWSDDVRAMMPRGYF